MAVIIKSFGHFIPDNRITNAELAQRFDVTEKWIEDKTGILERRYSKDDAPSDMIVKAANHCLEKAGVLPQEIDCVLVSTITPDYNCPSTASVVHHKLGLKDAAGFDISAACAGYVYALQLASSLINSKTYKNVLVCCAEKFSSVINPMDKKTALIGSDGAGVSLLQYSETGNGIIDIICKLESTDLMDVNIQIGGSKTPVTSENINDPNRYLQFSGKNIFDKGVQSLRKIILEMSGRNNISFDDINYIVTHQANGKMIESLAQVLNLSIDRFIINIEYIGNTGAATIPIAISEAIQKGKLIGNEKLLIASVGAGYTYGSAIIQLTETNNR